jgi:hypothetical protein
MATESITYDRIQLRGYSARLQSHVGGSYIQQAKGVEQYSLRLTYLQI